MVIAETERLRIRHFNENDAPFFVKLLNEEAFINNIADKGVRTINDAVDYIRLGPMESYKKFGYGLNLVELKLNNTPIGTCGILKREQLDLPDLGYALLTEYFSHGYAIEAAHAVLKNAVEVHGLTKVLAVTKPENTGSLKILEKLGFKFVKMIQLYDDQPEDKMLEYVF